ncbi:uncharacterized protein JCM15063_003402 [Sporobolomyces koalae]|uniref:uncharacterized protein n=1 Tax=Sporobolomyces koalae TaxID=500713 RepID=UPI00317E1E04
MSLDEVRDELLLLKSSLTEDEMRWVDEEIEAEWEPALETPDSHIPSKLPTLILKLARDIELLVEYRLNELPCFTLHAGNLNRDDQARLAAEVERETDENAREVATLPVFTLFTSIKEWLIANPLRSTTVSESEITTEQPRRVQPSGPIALKTTLIWSHHLLATSKRKDIVAWSTELGLFGVSKPGYPGVIVIEGMKENVEEFVWRIKQLQWKALQIRCEEDGDVVTPPEDIAPTEAVSWVVRNRSHLGPVLSRDPNDKICVREVEKLNDLGDIMRQANLEEVFLTALKISK